MRGVWNASRGDRAQRRSIGDASLQDRRGGAAFMQLRCLPSQESAFNVVLLNVVLFNLGLAVVESLRRVAHIGGGGGGDGGGGDGGDGGLARQEARQNVSFGVHHITGVKDLDQSLSQDYFVRRGDGDCLGAVAERPQTRDDVASIGVVVLDDFRNRRGVHAESVGGGVELHNLKTAPDADQIGFRRRQSGQNRESLGGVVNPLSGDVSGLKAPQSGERLLIDGQLLSDGEDMRLDGDGELRQIIGAAAHEHSSHDVSKGRPGFKFLCFEASYRSPSFARARGVA
ncbi:hypothetical protein CCP2SC5_160039 [Azospirillaceae bacterium]